MKIVKKELEINCPLCHCKVEINKYDALYYDDGWFIKCPECQLTFVKVAKNLMEDIFNEELEKMFKGVRYGDGKALQSTNLLTRRK